MLVKNNVTINRKMVNVELTDLIGDITTHPDDHTIAFFQKPDGEREELGEFLYQYLQRRFGVENMITEWGYNLYDACGRYSHDPRIGLFYGILQKEVRLTVFFFSGLIFTVQLLLLTGVYDFATCEMPKLITNPIV